MTTATTERTGGSPRSSVWQRLVHRPRTLWLRRALFQVHLWLGLLLAAYLVVISLTGAILVFETELNAAMMSAALKGVVPGAAGTAVPGAITRVVLAFGSAYPGGTVSLLTAPSAAMPVFQLQAADRAGREVRLVADAGGAHLTAWPRSWLDWTHDLHNELLLGTAHGFQVNGVGGGLLLLVALSGLVVWWPGIRHWRRALVVCFQCRWRRINYDAHSAIGIWTLVLVSWWGWSGLYFGWYRQVAAAVNAVSPLSGMLAPSLPASVYTNPATERVPLDRVLAAAQTASPAGHLYSLTNATLAQPTVSVAMDLRAAGDFSHRDMVTVDAVTGRVLSTWHYGSNHSLGDWVLWSMHPMHFGTVWGLPVKCLWCGFGLCLAMLTVTGVVMYWNRYLRHRIL